MRQTSESRETGRGGREVRREEDSIEVLNVLVKVVVNTLRMIAGLSDCRTVAMLNHTWPVLHNLYIG